MAVSIRTDEDIQRDVLDELKWDPPPLMLISSYSWLLIEMAEVTGILSITVVIRPPGMSLIEIASTGKEGKGDKHHGG